MSPPHQNAARRTLRACATSIAHMGNFTLVARDGGLRRTMTRGEHADECWIRQTFRAGAGLIAAMFLAGGSDGAEQTAGCANARWLQCGLDGLEQLEAHRAVVAPQRNHETHFPIRRGNGVTRQRADAVEGARLVRATIMAAKELACGAKRSSTLARPRAVKRLPRLMPEPSSRWMASARPCAARNSCATCSDFSRLTGPPLRCPPISRKTWFAM